MTYLKIKFYSDPGHGWAAVKRGLLADLGLLDKVSQFSYQRGQTVYLEEDSDLPKFLMALSMQRGQAVQYFHRSTDRLSPIRSYDRFVA